MTRPLRPRDERGWRVPTEGTKSRAIYDLMVQGLKADGIAARLGWKRSGVAVLMCHIKYAEEKNARDYAWAKVHPRVYVSAPPRGTPYQRKLVRVLKVTWEEAERIEREGR